MQWSATKGPAFLLSNRAQGSDCAAIGSQRVEIAKSGGGSRSEPDRRHGIYSRDGLPNLPNVHSDEAALKRSLCPPKVTKVTL